MTLYQDWQSFRRGFTDPQALGIASVSYTFAAAVGPTPATITRSVTGDWPTAGFTDGITAFVSGTALNDGEYLVDDVATDKLELASGSVLQAEVAPAGSTVVEGFIIDKADRMEIWPVALVRAAGFTGSFGTGLALASPYTGTPANILLSVNASAADAAFGVDEYDWYVSSRTDVAADQYFNATKIPDLFPSSFSGSMRLEQNLPAILDGTGWNGSTATLTPAINVKIFKYTDVYARRRSDGAIQWINLLRAMQATA